jgi:outer membrane immunogenic protein
MKRDGLTRVCLVSALLVALFAASGGMVAAQAAEPAYDWSGFYAGAHLGYGHGQSPTTVTPDATEATIIMNVPGVGNVAPVPDTSGISGVFGGGHAGYNFQYSSLVIGLEADISGAGWRSSGAATGPDFIGGTFTTAVTTRLDWFGTVRGRVGALIAPSLLVYGTGGLAYGQVETSVVGSNISAISCDGTHYYCVFGASSGVSTGWSAGAGVEYGFARAWSLKAEYLHIDLGDRSATFADRAVGAGSLSLRNSFSADLVEIGLNYHFGR